MFFKRLLVVASLIFLTISSCDSSSNSKRLLLTLKCSTGRGTNATHVAYSTDGKLIASCYEEDPSFSEDPRKGPPGRRKGFDFRREVKVWDAHTGKELMSINKGNITRSTAFFPNNPNLACAVDNTVRICDTITGKEKLVLKGHADVIHDLDISLDGKWLATASSDGTVKVWDARSGTCLHTLKAHPKGVLHVSFSPDGKRIACTGGDRDRKGEIQIWDWVSEKQVLSISHGFLIGTALFSPAGKHLACYRFGIAQIRRPGLIEVWDASSGKLLFRRESHLEELTCVAYSPNGKFLASGFEDGTVVVRDGVKGEEVLKLTTSKDNTTPFREITSIAFSPHGDKLATASWDGTVKVWDIKDVAAGK